MPPSNVYKQKGFEESFLQGMTAPLTVHCYRLAGRTPSPFQLPLKEGQSVSGVGWSHDDVRMIGHEMQEKWERREMKDGTYMFSVTDQQSPPRTMEWEMIFSPQAYPLNDPNVPQPAPQQFAPPMAPPFTGQVQWPRTPVAQPNYPQPYAGPSAPAPAPSAAPGVNLAGYGADMAFARTVEQQLRQSELDRMKLQDQLAQQQQQSRHKEEISALERKMDALATALSTPKEAPRRADDDPMIVEMRNNAKMMAERLDRQEKQAAEDRAKAERDRLEAKAENDRLKLEAKMEADRVAHKAEIAELKALITAAPKGPDPVVTMLSQLVTDMKREQMTARDISDLVTKATAGSDAINSKVVEVYSGALAMIKNGVEMVQGIQRSQPQQGGSNPFLEAGAAFVSQLPEVINGFINRDKPNVVQQPPAQEPQVIVLTQEEADAIRASHVAAQTAQNAQAPAEEQAPAEGEVAPASEPTSMVDAATAATGSIPLTPQVAEMKLFGAALQHVKDLRASVRDGLAGDKEKLDTPEKAAAAIMQAILHVQEQKLDIKAFSLFATGQVGTFVDALVPEAPPIFRNALTSILLKVYNETHQRATNASNGQRPTA